MNTEAKASVRTVLTTVTEEIARLERLRDALGVYLDQGKALDPNGTSVPATVKKRIGRPPGSKSKLWDEAPKPKPEEPVGCDGSSILPLRRGKPQKGVRFGDVVRGIVDTIAEPFTAKDVAQKLGDEWTGKLEAGCLGATLLYWKQTGQLEFVEKGGACRGSTYRRGPKWTAGEKEPSRRPFQGRSLGLVKKAIKNPVEKEYQDFRAGLNLKAKADVDGEDA